MTQLYATTPAPRRGPIRGRPYRPLPTRSPTARPLAVDASGRVEPDAAAVFRPDWPLDLRAALAPHLRGLSDPTLRLTPEGAWRTTTTPCGPATVRLVVVQDDEGCEVRATAWGPGAAWAVAGVPGLLGADDDVTGFDPTHHPLVERTHHRSPHLRLGRSLRVWDALVPAVLEQKVTTVEAHRVWRALIRLCGEPAPGPAPEGMAVVPCAEDVLAVTDWQWHRCGLDGARRRALRAVASVASRLEVAEDCDSPTLQRRLRTVPGIGVWTAAEVVQRALGCPDTVSYGDYHLKNLVGWSLAGEKTDDDGMMALLEPWTGHRQRVVRLLAIGGGMPPRRGPRMAPTDYRAI